MSTPAVDHAPRVSSPIDSLATLVGGHPDALAQMYARGRATDPAELGDAPRGRLLALLPGADLFLVLRPLICALAVDAFPWRGKVFDHGGASGQNVVFGRRIARFTAEVGPSRLDGAPALLLDYAPPAHGNPWPVRALRDELRTVGPGVAMGPAFHVSSRSSRLLLWFGLEAARS